MPSALRFRWTGQPFRRSEQSLRNAQTVIPAQAGIQESPVNEKQPVVYIMASKKNGTLHIGVTSDLPRRVWEHAHGDVDGFTQKHGVHTLVYYEYHDDMTSAITREKQIKKWNRSWKLRLIEGRNPNWTDLSEG